MFLFLLALHSKLEIICYILEVQRKITLRNAYGSRVSMQDNPSSHLLTTSSYLKQTSNVSIVPPLEQTFFTTVCH